MRGLKHLLLSFVVGGLVAIPTLVAQTVVPIPPLPVCIGCRLDTNSGWMSNNYGSVSTTAACALNGTGDGCDLSGTVTFTPGATPNQGGTYGGPCNGGVCSTVPPAGGTFGVGMNHATQTWTSIPCDGTGSSDQVVAFILIWGSGAPVLHGQRIWTCLAP